MSNHSALPEAMPKILHDTFVQYAPTLPPPTMIVTQKVAYAITYHFCKPHPSYYMSSFSLKNTSHIQKSANLRVKTTSESSEKSILPS